MSALLILKLIIPLFISVKSLIRVHRGQGIHEIVTIAAGLTTVCVGCLYQVVDEGSWLDIGLGISHYIIANFLSLFGLVALSLASTKSNKLE